MRKLLDTKTGSFLVNEESSQVYFQKFTEQSVKTLSLVPEEHEISEECKAQLVLTTQKEKELRDREMEEIERKKAERQFR